MLLGFVHFDRSDQKKYLAVLSKISEGGAIDELGVGRIRDYYSDLLFPGVSSLHQHAKYFSLMPLLYRESVKNKYLHFEDVRAVIRRMEIDLTRRLCEGSPGAPGITGSDALRSGAFVKYDPMYIYGMALQTYGIVRTENIEGAIYHASKKYHERPVKLSANDQEQGDSEDKDSIFSFCVCPSDLEYDWLTECSLDLTPNEASFIRNHILEAPACKDSLLHYILDNKISLDGNIVPTFETFLASFGATLPVKLQEEARKAAQFSDLVDGLFLYYNWLYSEKMDADVYTRFRNWYDTEFVSKRDAMMDSVSGIRINDNGSIPFCIQAIDLLDKKDWAGLDLLIPKRERRIKGSRFKIANGKGGFHYNPDAPIHNYKVEFRWATVRTLVNEILGGLADE